MKEERERERQRGRQEKERKEKEKEKRKPGRSITRQRTSSNSMQLDFWWPSTAGHGVVP